MPPPWKNWYHVTGNTYGTWLPGDPRGWRARHHREHVEGDYKDPPPPGTYDRRHQHARRIMRRGRIILTPQQRRTACLEIADTLRFHSVEVVDVCVGAKHFHILARFQPLAGKTLPTRIPIAGALNDAPISQIRTPRHLVGIAKKQSAKKLTHLNLAPAGGIWGVRCKPKPIKDRQHQVRVALYIRAHVKEGAAVWSLIRDAQQ